MDNDMILRTVLIILAAFVLFALINYYNNKQTTIKSEKFFNQAASAINGATMSSSTTDQYGDNNDVQVQPSSGRVFNAPDLGATLGTSKSLGMQSPVFMENMTTSADAVKPSDPLGEADFRAVDYESRKLPNDCFPKDRVTAEDLLPKDAANSKWAQVNPAGQGDVKDQNFLTAGYMFGINTVGSSLKNPNLQLRSEPVIPKVSVGPFLNSSYEASDALRRPLEIGGDC